MKQFLADAVSLSLAGGIYERLEEPRAIGVRPTSSDWRDILKFRPKAILRVDGSLPLRAHGETGRTRVGVHFSILPDWLNQPPLAATDAIFLRREMDWHAYDNGYCCYVLIDEWKWYIDRWWNRTSDMGTIANDCASWCVQNLDSLITRHLIGRRFGLSKWPPEWEQWSHSGEGAKAFRKFLRRNQQRLAA